MMYRLGYGIFEFAMYELLELTSLKQIKYENE